MLFWQELTSLQGRLRVLETQLLLTGEHDHKNALVTVRAGSGGREASDFARMLMRMYLRWAENHHHSSEIYAYHPDEGDGIKSVTFRLVCAHAYGMLAAEQGTHRLVRMSPFDNLGRRQTSFAEVEVLPELETEESVDIPEKDLKVDVYRSSGPGGQSVNTTDSAVRLTHLPSGIVVTCQNEKSQRQNKESALRVLQAKLLIQAEQEHKGVLDSFRSTTGGSWGNQIRSYVLQPRQEVKDQQTGLVSINPLAVLDGKIEEFLEAGMRWRASN